LNRIDAKFAQLKEAGDKALVCFLTAGDPSLNDTVNLVLELAQNGADIVELGVPFSDPLADGPSIQAASFRALERGATVQKVLQTVALIREKTDIPTVLMTYFNPVNHYGAERFAREAANCGADGVILTDLPFEEDDEWKKAADSSGLATISLLAPTSTQERMAMGAKHASGFIYCVSRTGVTGARTDGPDELADLIGRIRTHTSLPVVVGFGISSPEHVRQVTKYADGAVIGSAIVNIIAESGSPDQAVRNAGEFVRTLKSACA